MDEYPPNSFEPAFPLMVVAGLPSNYAPDPALKDRGFLLRSDKTGLPEAAAKLISNYLNRTEAYQQPLAPQSSPRLHKFRFTIAGTVRTPKLPLQDLSLSRY